MRWVRAVFGGLSMVGALWLAHRAVYTVAAHDYVLALLSTFACVAALRASVDLLSAESAE